MTGVNRRFFDSLLADKKLSLRALAGRMGMNHSQLSLTFSGARKLQLEEAAQLSNIFGIPLHTVVENAGIAVKNPGGGRVKVIGAVRGDGTVALHEAGTVERTSAPNEVPKGGVAVQFRTASTGLDWLDGAVMFCKEPDGIDPGYLGRVCLCKLKDGPVAVAMVRRGYKENTVNLAGPFTQESAILEWASPITWTRN